MNQFATEYQHLDNDELLQVWAERSQLISEAKVALREEIRRRGMIKDAERAVDTWAKPPEPKLDPPVETFLNVSALWFWVREVWLRSETRDGVSVPATVDSTRSTRAGYRSARRVELCYSYEYQGKRYTGRAVRDFMFNSRAADALAFGRRPGESVVALVNPRHPDRSYFPSGFDWIEGLVLGVFGLGIWAVLLLIVFASFQR